MRTLMTTLALLLAPTTLPAGPPKNCCQGEGKCGCVMNADEPIAPHGPAAQGPMGAERGMSAAEHGAIFQLLSRHDAITRTVTLVPGGVRTTTTTTLPQLVPTLRTHVRQMSLRLEREQPVRIWDPVFREVFAHAAEIKMAMRDIDGGIEVIETSEDPSVVPLIRAHAEKVSSFVAKGHEAARPPWAGGGRGRMRRGR